MDPASQIINTLGLIYVGLPLIVLVIGVIMWIFGKTISKEMFEKIIEIGKWYLVSVALVFAVRIIDTGFSDRETGMKEMQVYDTYVETILQADNIEARWLLAEYFAAVTPTERLRYRWIEYKDTIKEAYEEFKRLRDKEKELEAKVELSTKERKELEDVRKNMVPFKTKLLVPALVQ